MGKSKELGCHVFESEVGKDHNVNDGDNKQLRLQIVGNAESSAHPIIMKGILRGTGGSGRGLRTREPGPV